VGKDKSQPPLRQWRKKEFPRRSAYFKYCKGGKKKNRTQPDPERLNRQKKKGHDDPRSKNYIKPNYSLTAGEKKKKEGPGSSYLDHLKEGKKKLKTVKSGPARN